MIRLATLLWIAIAGVMGYGLYQLKHEVMSLEAELGRVNRQIVREQENIHVLRAEWAYTNQPQRLQALAQRHLDLAPMSPRQFGRLDNLGGGGAGGPGGGGAGGGGAGRGRRGG
ncbi:MAG: hypothetical protein ACK5XB_14995, partial [Rhodospirillales bacterium]